MSITKFLLARITEDEQIAYRAAISVNMMGGQSGREWSSNHGMIHGAYEIPLWDNEGSGGLCMHEDGAVHSAIHDPARVLAECAAKRAIVELHNQDGLQWTGFPRADKQEAYCVHDNHSSPCKTLRHLATVYADHDDYQTEWNRSSDE